MTRIYSCWTVLGADMNEAGPIVEDKIVNKTRMTRPVLFFTKDEAVAYAQKHQAECPNVILEPSLVTIRLDTGGTEA